MTKEEFLLRKQELADKLFDLARGFEELMDEARNNYEEANNLDDENYWDDMQFSLEDVVNTLDDTYSDVDEAEEESSLSDISDEDVKEFEDLIDELEKEDCDNDF